MSDSHLNLLVDTNVWLDHLLGRAHAEAATALLSTALEHDDVIAVTPSVMKDVFFLICVSLKRSLPAQEGAHISKTSAQAINEIAWNCLSTIQRNAIVLNQGPRDHLEAMTFQDAHRDYEDDLLLATAQLSQMDYVVTNDKALLANEAFATITPEGYLLLRSSSPFASMPS